MQNLNLKYLLILLVFVWGHVFAQLDGFNHCRHSEHKDSYAQTEHSCCSTEESEAAESGADNSDNSADETCVNFASIAPPQNLFFEHLVDVIFPIVVISDNSLLLADPESLDHPPRA